MSTKPPRLEMLDAQFLEDSPRNWKFHPPDQTEALAELIGELGWLKPLVWNERTGKLLDGHGRKPIAVAAGKPVPVYIVDLPEELEGKALATLDSIGWTSVADRTRFESLLKGANLLKTSSGKTRALLESVARASTLLGPRPDAGADGDPDAKDREDAEITVPLDSIWPSSNAWDVPDLLIDKPAASVAMPVWTWGTIGQHRHMPGTYHFYTADSKFEPLFRRPNRVLYSRCAAVVEPNYSTTDQSPLAQSLWSTFRKRWISRYWQACGLSLFVDLNVHADLNKGGTAGIETPINLLGVPRGWSSYASRAHANGPDALLEEWEVAREWSGSRAPIFLVVGGGQRVKAMAKEKGWVWVPEQQQLAHPRPDPEPEASDDGI